MPKTIQEIVTDMDTAQAADPTLSGLTSPSATAWYTRIKYMVATVFQYLYDSWDAVLEEYKALAATFIIGTRAWYVTLAKGYNSGTLVAKASCLENGTKVILKVAKEVGGVTAQLTNTELINLTTYVNEKKVAGTDIDVISQTADLVDIEMDIQYLNTIPQATVEADVEQAINDYLANLPFDTDLSKTLLVDEILNVTGVVNAFVQVLKVDIGAGYTVVTGNNATTDAGYWEVGKQGVNDLITLNMYT